jgi:hypothetical protein
VVVAVDKNDVRLTILASVILVGAPLIARAFRDLRSAVGMSNSAVCVAPKLPVPAGSRLT